MPEHVEYDPLLGYLQQRFVGLDEARLADEVDYFGHDTVPFEATPANDEENPSKESSRYQVQDDQDRSCHCSDDGKAHEKMRYALLDHAFGNNVLLVDLMAVARLDDFEYALVVSHAVGMHRSLRYKSIWQRDVDYPSNEACTSEQEEIPMKAAGFLEWELPRLCCDTALILSI